MKRIKRIIILLALLAVFMGFFLFISYRANNSVGSANRAETITIEKGDNVVDVSRKLAEKDLISWGPYFVYYAWTSELTQKIVAGEYEIEPKQKIPEIIKMLIKGETRPVHIAVTFPEGWTAEAMAERLTANKLPGDDFVKIIQNPSDEIKNKYDYLKNLPKGATLEGFLFPDTYFFSPEESAQSILLKMLKNFDIRLSQNMRGQIENQKKDIFSIITMASIIETEVKTENDRAIVSGIFWNRLKIDMALQSDATVAYALGGKKKIQHNASDISISSPYNTYRFKGLPPGPVSNPGLSSIRAAISPENSNYLYFLNNPETGQTFFAVTFEEHVSNKAANGL